MSANPAVIPFSYDLLTRLGQEVSSLEEANVQRSEALAALEFINEENGNLRRGVADSAVAATMLTEMVMNKSGLTLQLEGGACQLLANTFADQFREQGGVNFVEMGFTAKDGLRLIVTMQKVNGKTPAQLRTEADQRAAAAEQREQHIERLARDVLTTEHHRDGGLAARQALKAYFAEKDGPYA